MASSTTVPSCFDRASPLTMIRSSTRECPNCHNIIPIDPGYPVWCDVCEWNLEVPERWRVKGKRDEYYQRLSTEMAEQLFNTIVVARPTRPKLTFSRLAALVIAGVIHLVVLSMALLGIALLWEHRNPGLTLLGGVLLALALTMRPRIFPLPRYNILPRQEFPNLYALTDLISERLGTEPVAAILFSSDLNAFFFKAGWSRKSFMCIGIPFLEVLTPQERVALIGHELAHGANGDAARSFFVGSAIRSLDRWRSRVYHEDDELGAMALGLRMMLLWTPVLVGAILRLMSNTLNLLLANDSQRGEYLADYMGARVGGSQAMANVLHKSHMEDALTAAMDRFYEMGGKEGVLDVVRSRVERVPPREIERVARIEKIIDSRLDARHPPTAYRTMMLQRWSVCEPEVELTSEDVEAMEGELRQVRSQFEDFMLQAYRDRINY